MRKRLIAAAIVVIVVAAGYFGYDYYFHTRPDDLADEFRVEARGAASTITSSMYATFVSFDRYLQESTIPLTELENVDDIDELRRRLIPVLNDTDDALDDARQKIGDARAAIKRRRASLIDTPSPQFLEDSEPIDETEAVARTTRDYISRAERFLGSYARFVEYARDDVDLVRREVAIFSQNEVEPRASLEAIEASIAAELEETQALRKARQKLEPHPDAEKLYELSLESTNITVDFLQQTDAALAALDVAGLDAAADDYLEESKDLGVRSSALVAELSRESGLSEATKSLSERGDALEDDIAVLGAEGKERGDAPRQPPVTPLSPPPAGDGGGSPGGEDPDSSIS